MMNEEVLPINEALQKLTIHLEDQQPMDTNDSVPNGEDALGDDGNLEPESQPHWNAVQRYEEEWQQLCRDATDTDDLGELRRRALLGSLRASRFRSVSWRLLLRLLPPDPEAWVTVLRAQREHFTRLSASQYVNPAATLDDNPLSQDTQSHWNQYFCNKELQAVIRQDVVRTFPSIDFFRERSVQDKMVSILFCYARANPDMCYRQGMHEILAPLLFVLHSDHQALMHSREQAPVSTLFCRIMAGIECCYRIHDVSPSSTGQFPHQPCNLDSRSGQETELMSQLAYIREHLLLPKDPQLAEHLHRLDISLTLFGIRWLRLLFGREFPLQDLLVLWDAIFAEAEGGSCFELVNFIVVAMLIAIRFQLLSGDYTTCLTYLMRYPGAVDISYIIENSLYLKDPEKYCQPASVSFPNLPVITIGGRTDMNRGPLAVHTISSQQLETDDDNKSKKNVENGKKVKGGKKKGDGTLSKRLSKLSTGRWGKQQPTPKLAANGDESIVEGYTLDDPTFVGAELQRAAILIRNSQSQLSQHIQCLENAIFTSDSSVLNALNGIKQIAVELGNFHCLPIEVEPATEAGEVRSPDRIKTSSSPSLSQVSLPVPSSVKLIVFSESQGPDDKVEGAPLVDPLNRHSS